MLQYHQRFNKFTQKNKISWKYENTPLPDGRVKSEIILTGLTYIGTGIGATEKIAQNNAVVNWCHYMDKNPHFVMKEIAKCPKDDSKNKDLSEETSQNTATKLSNGKQ